MATQTCWMLFVVVMKTTKLLFKQNEYASSYAVANTKNPPFAALAQPFSKPALRVPSNLLLNFKPATERLHTLK
ncbi:predicted protein [Sclerotinia sclerotiorum 1980 UF-70]|uniref:Uncharacterized protein n=1 Tax=Sclerotinia sclerotiorum (strain ATCC 18683 / 1980 / Ss-1) TaxID=665079 RepID=A7EEV8_SCLS1|nr:predicted protein [Sclerotinia sclerotiorum 1980 UF-70]EDO01374.1 predicted protein [Sclerotinia sclerotiorum 1980 UF-70]